MSGEHGTPGPGDYHDVLSHDPTEEHGDVSVSIGGTWDTGVAPHVTSATIHAAVPGADGASDPAAYTFGDDGSPHSDEHPAFSPSAHDQVMAQIHAQTDPQEHFDAAHALEPHRPPEEHLDYGFEP